MITATRMETIARKKKQTIEQLDVLRKNYIIAIYRGVCHNKSVKEIHKKLLDETIINIEEQLAIDNNMLKFAKKLTKEAKNIAKENKFDVGIFAPIVFKMLTSTKNYDVMSRMAHDNARKFEAELKNDAIWQTLDYNRKGITPKVFYIASAHADCAKDHADYQGKVYIDSKWKEYITDKTLRTKIESYVNVNKVKTFQWVTGKPVWFITRPNCRHFFRAIDTETLLKNSVEELRVVYNLNRVVGDRQLTQTIAHDTRQERYKKSNVENIIKQYEDRYNLHLQLKKIQSNQQISYALAKDRLLIKKWKDYYRTHFKSEKVA